MENSGSNVGKTYFYTTTDFSLQTRLSFLQETLAENAGFFFIPLTARLVNDDSANCRQLAGYTIKLLLKKVRGQFNYA